MSEQRSLPVGQRLAEARQAKGLSLDYVADKLKLSVHQVEAIEAEDFSHLPAPVFVRGFVRNYARLVGLDANAMLAALDLEQKPTEQLTAPSEGVRLEGSRVRKWLLVPLVLLLLFLILVAGLYAWLSQGEDALVPLQESAQTEAPVAEVVPLPLPATAPPVAAEQAAVPPTSAAPTDTTADQAAPQAAPAQPPLAAPAVPPSAESQTARPGPAAAGSVLRFRVEDDAWIQVVDGAGQRYSRLVRAGSTETLRGAPPFKLVVGNAAQVKLDYNDHAIDLTPFIGDKVARLTLE